MKKLISKILLLVLVSSYSYADYEQIPIDSIEQGIHFENGLHWQQIVAKATAENKFIFVDCFTTWCGPCKRMDKEVYSLQKVGEVYNEKFVSVKMQMDSSANDNDEIKSGYTDASYLQKQYKVLGYPSYLIFTPDGKILTRSLGAKNPDEFIAMANSAINPEKNYYTVSEKFKQGKTNADETAWLANQAESLGDTATSLKVADSYIRHLNKDSLFTKSNIGFVSQFTKSPTDVGFRFLYNNAKRIDSIVNDDIYCEGLIQGIIYREIVIPRLNKISRTETPDWNGISSLITKKYNRYYAGRVVTAARSSWAGHHNNSKEYIEYLVLFQDKYGSKNGTGLMASLSLNNYAWEVFTDSNDPKMLQRALSWSKRAIFIYPDPGWMDTYANILYKLGKNKDVAIMWETMADKLDNGIYKSTLEKMKSNQPTWPANK